ncbi:MAG: thioesterase family protein [Candidatus Competibacteraceae bacterium]
MARLHFELPADFLFATELEVRIADINYAGHLSNDALLALLHEARVRFLASYGLREPDAFGFSLVIADAAVIYKSEAFQGEVLKIEVTVTDFNKYGCDFVYRVTEKQSGREVARAKIGMVFFSYAERRIQPMPEPFRMLFSEGGVVV